MLVSCIIISCLIHFNRDNSDATISMATIIFVLIFVIFFQFGVGPIPPFITSELFVTAQRSVNGCIVVGDFEMLAADTDYVYMLYVI